MSGQLGLGVALPNSKTDIFPLYIFPIIIMVIKEFHPIMNRLLMSLEMGYVNSIVFTTTTSLFDPELIHVSIDI